MYITNSFSLNMLANPDGVCIDVREVSLADARGMFTNGGFESAIGHADTAAVVSSLLGIEIPSNRISLSIEDEEILVAQYTGPRLPEGAKTLPDGSEIRFYIVSVEPNRIEELFEDFEIYRW